MQEACQFGVETTQFRLQGGGPAGVSSGLALRTRVFVFGGVFGTRRRRGYSAGGAPKPAAWMRCCRRRLHVLHGAVDGAHDGRHLDGGDEWLHVGNNAGNQN